MAEYLIQEEILKSLCEQIKRICNIEDTVSIVDVVDYLSKTNSLNYYDGDYLVQAINAHDNSILKTANVSSGATFKLPETSFEPIVAAKESEKPKFISSIGNYIIIGNTNATVYLVDSDSIINTTIIKINLTNNLNVDISQCIGVTVVDWGDGIVDTLTTHSYAMGGEYIIKVYNMNVICLENIGSRLNDVKLDSNIIEIAPKAFYYCPNLESITIPDSITSIGNQAFWNCEKLSNITIPDSVISIGKEAFAFCSGLTSITIPDSVTSIGNNVFYNCSALKNIIVEEENPVYHSEGNCLIHTENKRLICGCQNSIIPDDGSVTSIEDEAFYYCQNLESISIPDSVKEIGSRAFGHCDGLTSIEIPNSVTSIGSYAFNSCDGLTSIVIPNSVTNIGVYAFEWCENLQSVTIGNGVTKIRNGTFCECKNLRSITISNSVTTIGYEAFRNCQSLQSITIPDSVTEIGSSAFRSCNSLTSAVYQGTEEEWKNVSIGTENDKLTSVLTFAG